MRVLRSVLGAVVLSIVTLTAIGQSTKMPPFDARVLLVDRQGAFNVLLVTDRLVWRVDESSVTEWLRGVVRGDASAVIHVAAGQGAPWARVVHAFDLVREAGATAVVEPATISP